MRFPIQLSLHRVRSPSLQTEDHQCERSRFRTLRNLCSLSSLKSAAGAFSDDQGGFATVGTESDEWVSLPDRHLEEGMFVAQVVGDSMEPEIPSGSYCLFRRASGHAPE